MSSALIGALRVVLGMDSAAFEEGLSAAEKQLNKFSKNMGKLGGQLASFGTKASLALTAPITAFGVSMVRTAGDFEASMNRVQAATSASATEFKAMEDMAMRLGAETSKSASDSANMMEMLAKNGLTAQEILDGAAESSIKLSEATGGELSRAADVTTNAMAQFGVKAKDMAGVVDQITAVTLASQFGFDDYALALGQAGGVAGALGVTFEDFNATIAATSDTFNSGSDAGTSLKQFLVSLVPQSKQAAIAISDLGLKFFDAKGNMKSMSEIAEELKTKMGGLSDEELNDAMKTIFGVDAMRTGIALMKEGGAGIDEMIEKVRQKGIAEEQAAARMKGWNGEMEKLGGAFENLQIKIAKSGILTILTGLVTKLAEWTDSLAALDPAILQWGVGISAVLAVLGPAAIAVGGFVTAIGGIASAIAFVGPALIGLVAAAGPIGLVIAGLTAAGAAIYYFWDPLKEFGAYLLGEGKAVWDGFVTQTQAVIDNCKRVGETIVAMKDQAIAAVQALYNGIAEWLGSKLDAVWNGVASKIEWLDGKFYALYDAVVGHSYIPDMVDEIGDNMRRLATEMVAPATDAVNKTDEAFEKAGTTGQNAFSGLGSAIADVIKGTKSLGEAVGDLLMKLGDSLLQNAFSGLFGGGGSSGGIGGGIGGIISEIWSGLTGHQNGGSFKVGGAGGIDSQMVAFRASPNETVSITKPGQDIGGGAGGHISVGVAVDDNGNLQAYVKNVATREANNAAKNSISSYDKGLPYRVDQINKNPRWR